ncbi:dienelactone hydrolase family protein [Portibacter lacus]|uniref:Dienelactone hydrolase n=1 Tax=Portibacter lacus TaxID=1099794 RepID=A0AA37WDQ2_9BACT|nr:dienelactone hydrolase family protein [Portibacter lacus]GLR17218.1 dienelactone hydrolase [Portibacter lacus]
MKKITKTDINQEVYDLYDEYAHNKIDRRDFMEKLSMYAIGGLTIPSILNHIMPNYEANIQIPADDPRLDSDYIIYHSEKGGGEIRGLLSMPAATEGKLPGVIVVHENRGLNPYIEDVGRRAAVAGFISIAPDALWPLGGYPGNDDEGRTMQRKRDKNEMLEDFIAAFEYLKNHPNCDGNIGVVGFCFGGWISNMMAVKVSELKAAVPFYGGKPPLEEVSQINAPLLLHFGELDTRVNEGWPSYEAALKENNKKYTAYIYEGANHGFHNDTTGRYDEEDAKLAWERTIEFFKENLV